MSVILTLPNIRYLNQQICVLKLLLEGTKYLLFFFAGYILFCSIMMELKSAIYKKKNLAVIFGEPM